MRNFAFYSNFMLIVYYSLILVYLISASLPLGYFPSGELLAAFDLQNQYEGLIRALRV